MWSEIIVAVCALIGTAITGLGGYKLVVYRLDKVEKKVDKIDQKVDNIEERQSSIEKKVDILDERQAQLDRKVEKHNNTIERTFILEEQMKVANHRLDDLERHEEQRVVRAK